RVGGRGRATPLVDEPRCRQPRQRYRPLRKGLRVAAVTASVAAGEANHEHECRSGSQAHARIVPAERRPEGRPARRRGRSRQRAVAGIWRLWAKYFALDAWVYEGERAFGLFYCLRNSGNRDRAGLLLLPKKN